jgi:nitrogen fixation protein FixH
VTPALRWGIAVVGLLLANVVAMGALVASATTSKAQVIPAYYEQALQHDDRVAEAAASRELAWRVEVELAHGSIEVELRDARGAPITGAQVRVAGYQRAVASDRFEVALTPIAPGRYRAERAVRAGLHDVIVHAERGDARFVEQLAREAP